MKRKTILVTGSTGQVGSELKHISKLYPDLSMTFLNRKQLDLASKASIKSAFANKSYDYCINAAAYTAVDAAETDKKMAHKVNALALSHLASFAPKTTKLIHLSTDYVYHTDPQRPLKETDPVAPQGVYASTKLEGEQRLLAKRPDSVVMRTSWVYSSYGNNFVKTMLRLGQNRDNLNIVADQYGTPTYARDIAHSLLTIIRNTGVNNFDDISQDGIFNYSNIGLVNWADFAREIFKLSKLKCQVGETTTALYGAPAPRPLWSLMSKSKIQKAYQLKIPHWKESLKNCLLELGYL